MSNIYLFIINSKKSGSVRHTNHIWTMTVYTDNNWEQKKQNWNKFACSSNWWTELFLTEKLNFGLRGGSPFAQKCYVKSTPIY